MGLQETVERIGVRRLISGQVLPKNRAPFKRYLGEPVECRTVLHAEAVSQHGNMLELVEEYLG